MSLLGLCLATCLHSSEPIEPPPPVTRTVLPWIKSKTSFISTLIGSLPKRSSIETFLRLDTFTSPFAIWYIPGRFFSVQFVSLQIPSISLLSSIGAEGIAIQILSTLYFSTLSRIESLPPTIGVPSINLFHLFLLSSIIQTTLSLSSLARLTSRRIICPADPAPIIITLDNSALLTFLLFLKRRNNLYANRMAITKQNWKTAPMM